MNGKLPSKSDLTSIIFGHVFILTGKRASDYAFNLAQPVLESCDVF